MRAAWSLRLLALALGCTAAVTACSGAAKDTGPVIPDTGTITGRIVSSIGGPMAHVRVTARPSSAAAPPAAYSTDSGTFRFDEVPATSSTGVMVVDQVPANCVPTDTSYSGLSRGGAVFMEVTVPCVVPTATVNGRVTSSLGGALAGDSVVITPAGMSPLAPLVTDSDGRFSERNVPVATGMGAVALTHLPGNCADTAAAYTGLRYQDTVQVNIVARCFRFGTLAGVVTDGIGDALAGVRVAVMPDSGPTPRTVVTDSAGFYSVAVVPAQPGSGTVQFSSTSGACSAVAARYGGLVEGATVTANVSLECQHTVLGMHACQQITAPGWYALEADLQGQVSDTSCVHIVSSHVSLDCGGHTITNGGLAIAADHVRDVTIDHCRLVGSGGVASAAVEIANAQNVAIENSTILGSATGLEVQVAQHLLVLNADVRATAIANSTIGIEIRGSDTGTVANSQVAGSNGIWIGESHDINVSHNRIAKTTDVGDGVGLVDGGGNVVSGNRIEGAWNGFVARDVTEERGDGVVLDMDTDDRVLDDTIQNVANAGVEVLGPTSDTDIQGNVVANAQVAGIAAFRGTSWTRVHVIGNEVTGSEWLVAVTYVGPRITNEPVPPIDFSGNSFRANSLQNRRPLSLPLSTAPFFVALGALDTRVPSAPALTAAHDTVSGNQLPANAAAYSLTPDTAFVDDQGHPVASRAPLNTRSPALERSPGPMGILRVPKPILCGPPLPDSLPPRRTACHP